MDALTTTEVQRLEVLESVIDAGMQTFVHVGNALLEIRDSRLYRTSHGTFEDYCRERWSMERRHAYRLIDAAQVVENVSNWTQIPVTESQARPLTVLEPEQQREVWQRAVETATNGKVTAAHVQAVVNEYRKQEPEQEQLEKPATATISVQEWNDANDAQRSDWLFMQHGGKSTFNETNDNIEWAAWSWNPVTGCLHDCPYCYARDIANRFYPQKFAPSFLPDRLSAPANTRTPNLSAIDDPVLRMAKRNVFVCSMADLFGKWVPTAWIDAVLQQAWDNPQWTFLFLTKFPVRMAEFQFPKNSWIGTTVDWQYTVDRAQKAFTKIRNGGYEGIAWLSCEPMMERLTFGSLGMFDWVIMGGSSKSTQTPEHRPPFEWIVHLWTQAKALDLPVYMKTNLGIEQRVREYPVGA
jgi:protein gp37